MSEAERDPLRFADARDTVDAFRRTIPYYGADESRLLSMLVALGGEVFVMRAELEAMRRAIAGDAAVASRMDKVRDDPDFQEWLRREELAFARHLLRPLPDDMAVDRRGAV